MISFIRWRRRSAVFYTRLVHTRKCNAKKPVRQLKMQNYVVPMQVSVLVLSKPLIRRGHAYVFGESMLRCFDYGLEMWSLVNIWCPACRRSVFLLKSSL